MCFSNLPIEFDDEGNPYLAEEAEEVDQSPESECGCAEPADDVALDEADPEAVYAAILETMPSDVRERVADSGGRPDSDGHPDDAAERPESARSD